MKSVSKKTNLLLTAIAAGMVTLPSAATQPNIPATFLHIKERAVTTSKMPKPEDLERQLAPVIAEINTTPDIHEFFINQILEIAIVIAARETEQAKKLKEELDLLDFAATTKEEVAKLAYSYKEDVIRSLSLESRITIFDRLGDRLFSSKKPFKIPETTKELSQLDLFLILAITITIEEEREENWQTFHNALASCIGLKDVLKIQTRLNKPEVNDLIPDSLKAKFFTKNPAKIVAIFKHIKDLVSSYAEA